MRRLLGLAIAAALLVGGCLQGQDISGNAVSKLLYIHDDAHGVGCWYYSPGGVSCLPDADYTR